MAFQQAAIEEARHERRVKLMDNWISSQTTGKGFNDYLRRLDREEQKKIPAQSPEKSKSEFMRLAGNLGRLR